MAPAAGQLLGRRAELGALDQLLGELAEGRSAALDLGGEPGIGKTRLLAELGERADARGNLVLSGSASELERDVPFAVFVDALDEYAEGLDPRRLDALDDQTRAELAHVLPSLSSLAGGGGVALQNERYRTHRAVRALLETLAATHPLVLVLDDLHWADSGSIELLGALLRRPPAGPVLLAMALRPRQASERLAAALERAHRAGRLVRLELGALDRSDARALLGEAVGGAAADALYEESGGNPFYLEQLARSAGRDGAARPLGDVSLSGAEVPRAVLAALAEEVGQLSERAQVALRAAAVAGDPFEPELVAAAAAVDEERALEALDELVRADLVRPTDVPRRFRFRHPLVRRAVYDASPAGWRLGAHQRSADALAERGAPATARAHHIERSARQGDAAALAVLREAGDAAAKRTPATAARWFAAALRLLGEDGQADGRLDLLTALAGAQAATGQFADARVALLEAIGLLPEDAGELSVRLTAACAGVEQLLGRHAEAHARLERCLRGLPDQRSAQAASLMITLALDAFFRQEHDASETWALRAVDLARATRETPLVAAAEAAAALAYAFVERIEPAQTHASAAAQLVDSMSDGELAVRLDAAAYLTAAEAYLDRFAEAAARGARGLRVARETGQGALLPILIQATSTALAGQGRLLEAVELLDGAIEASRLAGNDQSLAWDLLNRSFVAVQLGEPEIAVTTIEEANELTRSFETSFVSTYVTLVRAVVRGETGEHAEAADLFLRAGGGPALRQVPGGWRAKYLELMARSLLALGRRADAAEALAHARAVAADTGLRTPAAWAARAAAAVALHDGDHREAAEQAVASAQTFLEAGSVVEAAVSRLVAGRALARAGERDRAIAELEGAVVVFEAAGARRSLLEAERELGTLGRRSHRRTRAGRADGTGLETLTERELELARLVVDRKTNPEIAAELYLSQKTVETHLRNIFRKVGVANRVELARLVEQAERGESVAAG
jgi:DNA-binding NarL/FixJ family response regulator